jgi:hypothetical protein
LRSRLDGWATEFSATESARRHDVCWIEQQGARVIRARTVVVFVLVLLGSLAPSQVSRAAPGTQESAPSPRLPAIAVGGGGWTSWLGTTLPNAAPAPAPDAVLSATPRAAGEPPVTAVVGADALWHNHDVVLRFVAQDDSGSVAAIQVRVDGGSIIDVPAATYQMAIPAPSDQSGDGCHLVEFRALDADGNLEDWKSVTVNIDTRRPSALALHAVGVMHTATAKVGFRVDDKAPNAGLANATIVISTWGGRDIKTLKLNRQSIGTDLVARFRCDLPRGFYRLRVEAHDLAGNAATAVARTRLVVTDWMRIHEFGARLVDSGQPVYATGTPIPRVDTGPHDSEGVRMYVSGGQLRNYPGGQARYGLNNLNTYRLTGDTFYLRRATAQAQRLLETHISYDRAWFYPQRYSRYRHSKTNNGELMKNPWYSGMAQGQVLSLMVSMYEATGETKYLSAARATLYCFLYRGPASRPWVVTVDHSSRLWIQEWPRLPLDYTYNGHMISTFGLYHYYRVTKDTLALLLFRAAASAALDYAPKFRNPGAISSYCLLHRTANAKYHMIHIACLRIFFNFTGEVAFARFADAYLQDYSGPSGLEVNDGSGRLQNLMSDSFEQPL